MATLLKTLQQEFDDNGNPLYGSVVVKNHDTATLSTLYSDIDLTPAPNPFNLPLSGRAEIFVGNGLYDVFLKDDLDGLGTTLQESLGVSGGIGLGLGSETVVNTIDEMKALTPGATDYVIVGGYYAKGDGKAIEKYWYDSTLVFATEPDNGGTIIQPLSAPAQGGWRGVVKGDLNPYMFGAKGDKTTDDITAINACITASVTLGYRKVKLLSGDYAISTSINLKTLLSISDGATVQGYFHLEGENPRTTRLIPKSNINGGMIECVNAGTGNAANARHIKITNIGFYADNLNNAWARYGIWFRWVAEVSYENLLFHNCVTKRAIYHDVVFVVNIKGIDGKGKEGNYIDSGRDGVALIENNYNTPQEVSETCTFSNSSGTLLVNYTTDILDGAIVKFSGGTNPTGISSNTPYTLTRISATSAKLSTSTYNYRLGTFIAYTDAGSGTITIRNAEADKMTGFFSEGTCTTTLLDTCRFSNYIYDINFGGGDLLQVHNCAPESAKYHGIIVSGSVANLNIRGNYFEGISGTYLGGTQATSIFLDAYVGAGVIADNFFNDDYVITLGGDKQMNSLQIIGNHFLTSDLGIKDNGAALNSLIIRDNDFYLGTLDMEIQPNTSDTRYKIEVSNNKTITDYFDRINSNINRYDLSEWNNSGVTFAYSLNKYQNQDSFDTDGQRNDSATAVLSLDRLSISSTANNHLKNKWITFEIPIITKQIRYHLSCNSIGYTSCIDGDIGKTVNGSVSGATGILKGYLNSSRLWTVQVTSGSFVATDILSITTGTGAGTMSDNQSESSNATIRIDDGVMAREYNLRNSVSGWVTRRCYYQVGSSATKLEFRIYPYGDSVTVLNPTIRQGLWGDDFRTEETKNSLILRPNADISNPFILYDKITQAIKMLNIEYTGTPNYPIMKINGQSGINSISFDGKNGIIMYNRIQGAKGADVASGNNITLGAGNYFDITGTTQINAISTSDWQAGSEVTLKFSDTLTVKYNTSGVGGTAPILLAGAVDFVASINDTLTLVYDGAYWREKARTVI